VKITNEPVFSHFLCCFVLAFMTTETQSHRMTPSERRSSFSLASIYALRMLGLFMVLPVFAIEARLYQGGDDQVAVGFAMGMYGLVQAFLQIPFGLAADRLGRKPVIVFGLLLLGLGSIIAASAQSVWGLALGRAIQGGGAVSAAVSALLADQTRIEVRTKGMALIGASIGLMFSLSLVLGPLLNDWGGLPLIFECTLALSLLGILSVLLWTPPENSSPSTQAPMPLTQTLSVMFSHDLLRLNVGVFILYCVQLASWMSVPALLLAAGVAKADHGWVYLPSVLLSFVVMGASLFRLERKGLLKPLFLGCIALVFLVQLGFMFESVHGPEVWAIELLLFLFFCGFNILEATQPSLTSKIAPQNARGTAMGVYNTLQSLGIFAGAALGGWINKSMGPMGLFGCCGGLLLIWFFVAKPMNYQPKPH
jgi:MFS family permease